MKKYTSCALLAMQLTWKLLLLSFALTLGLQIFDGFRELMPGGVPLQVTFGYETLLRSAVMPAGKYWMCFLIFELIGSAGSSRGSKTVYTMNRLGLSEMQATLVFGAVFTGYFLLYWVFQLAVCYGFFVWYSRVSLVGSNTFMLAAWRSEWLHTLLPLNEWWGYLRDLVVCLSFGFSAACGSALSRRGRHPLMSIVPPALCILLLDGRIGEAPVNLLLTLLLAGYTIAYCIITKGVLTDEDL